MPAEISYPWGMKKPRPIRQADPNQTAKAVLDQALSKAEAPPARPIAT